MSEKKPQAGEWWEHCELGRVYVCGFDPDGDPVYMFNDACEFDCDFMNEFFYASIHLPDCTGWDWQEPEPVEATGNRPKPGSIWWHRRIDNRTCSVVGTSANGQVYFEYADDNPDGMLSVDAFHADWSQNPYEAKAFAAQFETEPVTVKRVFLDLWTALNFGGVVAMPRGKTPFNADYRLVHHDDAAGFFIEVEVPNDSAEG